MIVKEMLRYILFIFFFGIMQHNAENRYDGYVVKFQHFICYRGLGACPPENFFLKWCVFGVYLDQILTLTNFEKYHFLYIFLEN